MIKSNEEVRVQKSRLRDKQKKILEKAREVSIHPINCICILET